jgi:hypothetical protein
VALLGLVGSVVPTGRGPTRRWTRRAEGLHSTPTSQ